ncbi:MAG: hypothetical protein OXI87_07920 [Albidovulum sp.]|nr:hypothetical protein [Albidovulum sp.]MDE0534579.1 hypothetical protein [Albidovulum sp.]
MNDGDYPSRIRAPLIELFIIFDFGDGTGLHLPGHGEGQSEGIFLQFESLCMRSIAAG